MMHDVVTIGGATRDIFMRSDRFLVKSHKNDPVLTLPYGEKVVSSETYYTYGGGAVNVAIGLSRLGLKVSSICSVGVEGTGRMIREILRESKVRITHMVGTSASHTGLSMFLVGKDGDHTAILERGANDFLTIKNFSFLKKTRWLYLSSLTGSSSQLIPKIFEQAELNHVRIAFNPGSKQLEKGYAFLKPFLEKTDILLLNYEEAETLVTSKTGRKPHNINEILTKISKMGPTITVITNGAKGSSVIFEDNIKHQKAHLTKAIDTTGAGDSFGSTFLYGVIKGYDLSYCLRIASVNSASVVSKMGAIDGLLSYNKIKSSPWL